MITNRTRSLRRWGVATIAAGALALTACAPEAPEPPTTTVAPTANQAALSAAAAWIDGAFSPAQWFPGFDPSTPDPVNSAQAIADLAALGVGSGSQSVRLDRLAADAASVTNDGNADVPGALARLVLAVVATGGDPHSFAGTNLVARLEATIQPDGRFGAQYANFDGSYRQGLSLAALSVVTPRPSSITPGAGQTIDHLAPVAWLIDQQCSDGSWMAFRSDTTAPCVEDPNTWTYKDSNGSAMAALGLSAVGASAPVDPTTWFQAVRGNDGGWGAFPAGKTTASDADSTGLVIAALEALGHVPDESAYVALRSFQLGDAAPVANRGAFFFQGSNPVPNTYATLDAVTALFDTTWPQALVPSH